MALLDRKAALDARLESLDLGELKPQFAARGWSCLGDYAFATPYAPSAVDDGALTRDVVEVGRNLERNDAKAPKLRRLFFEAYSLAASDVRQKPERGQDDAPRRLPAVERASRLTCLQTGLQGQSIRGPLEPATCVVDAAVQMFEEGTLR